MKRLVSLALALILAMTAFVFSAAAEEDDWKYGMLTYLNQAEDEDIGANARTASYLWLLKKGYLSDFIGVLSSRINRSPEICYYDSLDALLMALYAGDIMMIADLNQTTVQYLAAQNDDLVPALLFDREKIEADGGFALELYRRLCSGFAFMLLEENEALRDELNAVIADMQADGTLDELIRTHIFGAINGAALEPIEIEQKEGRDTITVAVTGSLPPMDYVSEDGAFAGFNTAVLAEMGKRLDKNITLIQVDSVGRAAALASGRADAVFWVRSTADGGKIASMTEAEYEAFRKERAANYSPEESELMDSVDEAIPQDKEYARDMPEGTIITAPYFVDKGIPVLLKSTLDALGAQ